MWHLDWKSSSSVFQQESISCLLYRQMGASIRTRVLGLKLTDFVVVVERCED